MRLMRFFPALSRTPVLSAILVFALVFTLAAPLVAHRYHAAITTVEFNERTGRIEVIHQIFAHDVEYVLSARLGSSVIIGEYDGLEAALRDYVGDVFALEDEDGGAIPLRWVGHEDDVNTLWLYYESAPVPNIVMDGLGVRNELMFELYDDQVNTVNIMTGPEVRTLTFLPGDHSLGEAR